MKARSSEIDLNKIDQPYTKLNKRVLFFDGDYVVLPDQVEEFLHYGDLDHLKVIEINEEVEKFNTLSDQQIKTKDSLNKINEFGAKWSNMIFILPNSSSNFPLSIRESSSRLK